MTSPFIEGSNIQYAWDSTSLGMLKTCPRLYYYTMIEGWGSGEESVHLRFGGEFHQALQEYEIWIVSGSPHEEALANVIYGTLTRTIDFDPDPDTKAGKYKSRNALLRTITNYLDHFRDDVAKTHILANGKPAVELSFRFELDWGPSDKIPYMLCGHLDKVVDYLDDLYVMDHKTTMTTPGAYYFKQFAPSNQMTLYSTAAKIILGSPVKGVIINAIQLLVDSNEFKRDFTMRTQDQLDEWMWDLSRWLDLAKEYALREHWPQNDTACDKFGGCRFREVCSKSPKVRKSYLKADFVKLEESERWNPLKSRA